MGEMDPMQALAIKKRTRSLGVHMFEDGGVVQIICSADIPTGEALDWAEQLIALKRRELDRIASSRAGGEEG